MPFSGCSALHGRNPNLNKIEWENVEEWKVKHCEIEIWIERDIFDKLLSIPSTSKTGIGF